MRPICRGCGRDDGCCSVWKVSAAEEILEARISSSEMVLLLAASGLCAQVQLLLCIHTAGVGLGVHRLDDSSSRHSVIVLFAFLDTLFQPIRASACSLAVLEMGVPGPAPQCWELALTVSVLVPVICASDLCRVSLQCY